MDDGSIESKSERFYDNSSAEESEITNATHTATSLHTQSTTPQQPSYSSPMERSVSGTTGSSADLSFTMGGGSSEDIIDEEYYNRHHHHRHDDDYNEEELKTLAQSLAPRVTNLLDTNEKVLENLLELSWTNDDGDDGDDENNLKSRADYLEDGMEDEWNGLSNAEQMLRDELGMVSMGFNFVVNDDDYDDDDDDGDYDDDSQEDYGDYDHENPKDINIVQEKGDDNTSMVMDEQTKIMTNQLDDEAVGEDVNCNHDNDDDDGYNDSNINNEKIDPSNNTTSSNKVEQRRNTIHHNTTTHSVPQQTTATTTTTMPSPTNRQAYTLYDHAKYVDLQFSNIDLGYPTCPLLTKNDAESLLDIPNFRHEMLKNMEKVDKKVNESSSECTNNNNNNNSSSNNNSDVNSIVEDDDDNIELQKAPSSQFKDPKSRMEAIQEIIAGAREFVKPMNRAALSRIFEGLVDEKKDGLRSKMKRSRKQNNSLKIKGGDVMTEKDGEDRGVSIRSNGDSEPLSELLPIRTVAIQIRPDVLCGAVMDAMHTAIHSLRGEITKRQGNHLRALVPGCWVPDTSYMDFRPDESENASSFVHIMSSPMISPLHSTMNGMAFLPPFVVDAQLCTRQRSRDGERVCLFRFFRIGENQIVDGNVICPPSPPHASINSFNADLIPDLNECNTILRESSALFQRMRNVATAGGNIAFDIDCDCNNESPEKKRENRVQKRSLVTQVLTSPLKLFSPSKEKKATRVQKKSKKIMLQSHNIIGEKAAQSFASSKLLKSFLVAPSVMETNESVEMEPIPSLSIDDWPFVQSSWRYITLCLNELDNRDLNYSSLVSCPFGAFPALPTLDVQYCSQIKAVCKENMITSLLKGAQELEEFAREAEYACAKLISLLQPTFLSYNLESPPQPQPISLSSYPLEFIPPEVSCPPWGQKVVEALNIVAAKSPSADSCFFNDLEFNATNKTISDDTTAVIDTNNNIKSEFQKAREASSLVLAAFMKQEDEELSARLGRKNLQVMDRLAKMQAHKRDLVITIRDAYGTNPPATKFANRFHAHAQLLMKESLTYVENDQSLSSDREFYPASDQVPLITCRSLSGKVPATCFITCHQIMLATHPMIGEAQTFLHKLSDISVGVKSSKSKSLLNPIPSTVCINNKKGEEIFSFRPLMGARPFKEFVDLVLDIGSESEEMLQFSSRRGLLYMIDEKEAVKKAALGKDR